MRSFCRKTCVHKILRFRGGVFWVFGGGGGGSADFIFMGAGIFLNSYSEDLWRLFFALKIILFLRLCKKKKLLPKYLENKRKNLP